MQLRNNPFILITLLVSKWNISNVDSDMHSPNIYEISKTFLVLNLESSIFSKYLSYLNIDDIFLTLFVLKLDISKDCK